MMRPIKAFRSKNELVYDAIRQAILQGELKPGERVIIDDIAHELQVSQIPVREALRQLEADGFLTIEPYVGAKVTAIEQSLIVEVFGLLEAMEIISGRAACQYATEGNFATLEAILNKMDNLLDDPKEWSQENVHFHRCICDFGKTPLVKHLMEKALDHWDRLRSFYLNDVFVHRLKNAQKQHWEMFEAIKARDCDRLETLAREHNRGALQAYMNFLDR